ncbi:MAG: Sugar-phosphate isomerase, RpiB/LacA/LacB family, partial [Parcubacteria group bacterium GW2011_GWA1_49_26]
RHNDSNLLSLGARFLSKELALRAVDLWLRTSFDGGRHERRLKKIKDMEEQA